MILDLMPDRIQVCGAITCADLGKLSSECLHHASANRRGSVVSAGPEGKTSPPQIPQAGRRGQRTSTSAGVIAAAREFALIASDDLIAGILNRNGPLTGYGTRWARERVTWLRPHYRIPSYKPAEDGIELRLNLSNAAQLLHIAPKTLRLAAEAGEIEALYPLPNSPWIFGGAVLATSSANAVTERARRNPKHPARSHPDQQDLFSSIT